MTRPLRPRVTRTLVDVGALVPRAGPVGPRGSPDSSGGQGRLSPHGRERGTEVGQGSRVKLKPRFNFGSDP